jgi:hypothetical protein
MHWLVPHGHRVTCTLFVISQILKKFDWYDPITICIALWTQGPDIEANEVL